MKNLTELKNRQLEDFMKSLERKVQKKGHLCERQAPKEKSQSDGGIYTKSQIVLAREIHE